MSLRALLRPNGEVSGAITCVLDITDSARARQELERRATFDPLTHCHNRSSVLGTLEHELEREDSTSTGVVYVDLDKFKPVNDKLGHAAGDELLVLVAERLKLASRDSDLVGRLGGDEFLVVLRDIPGPEMAMRAADRICEALCGSFELSCGIAELQCQRRRGLLRRRTDQLRGARQARRRRDVPVKAARAEPAGARASRLKQIPRETPASQAVTDRQRAGEKRLLRPPPPFHGG